MDRSTPPPAPVPVDLPAPAAADLPTPADVVDQAAAPKPQGRLPGLIAAIRDYRAVPPERALYREMLQQAVGRTITTYIVGGYEISAATIKLVGWVIFGRMNAAGCVVGNDGRPFSRTVIAADASIGERACRAAIGFLKTAGLLSSDPAQGRRREMLRVNPWGLNWNAVKRRVKVEIHRNRGDAASPQEQPSQEQLSLSRRVVGATAQDRRVVGATTLRDRRVVGATALQGYVSEGYVQERPGPQAGGAAVPSTTLAEAPAKGRAAALDVEAIIARDLDLAEAAHRAKTADGKSPQSPKSPKSPTTKSGHLKGCFSGEKSEPEATAVPRLTAVEKSIPPPPIAFESADHPYTDEEYRADERAYLERMADETTARASSASRCAQCGEPDPGTVCPRCGAGNSAGRPSADTTAGGDA